ncbi:MAG TPA: TerB family tellurite resistance protein [Polyangia bacterium]|nr:TerB family tellurite resistance protein [Polyangia bacterium]
MGAISFAPAEAQEIARALAAIAAADGAIQQREASVLDEFAMSHSVGGMTFIPEPLDVDKLARIIRGDAERREVLRLCIKMALADGKYAPEEARAIETIATAFDVLFAELQTIYDGVASQR